MPQLKQQQEDQPEPSPLDLRTVSNLTTKAGQVWTLAWPSSKYTPCLSTPSWFANKGEVRSPFKLAFFKDEAFGFQKRITITSLGVKKGVVASGEIRTNVTPMEFNNWHLNDLIEFSSCETDPKLVAYWKFIEDSNAL